MFDRSKDDGLVTVVSQMFLQSALDYQYVICIPASDHSVLFGLKLVSEDMKRGTNLISC